MIEQKCEQYRKYLAGAKEYKERYNDQYAKDMESGIRKDSLTIKDIIEAHLDHGRVELARDRFILTIRANDALYSGKGMEFLDPVPKEDVDSKVKIIGHRVVVEGDLAFKDDFGKLPDNLFVKGDLNLGQANISDLPRKLAAHTLVVREGLRELPGDITHLDEINILLLGEISVEDPAVLDIPLVKQAKKLRKQGIIQKILIEDREVE